MELIAVLRRSGHTSRQVSEGNMAISALNLNNNAMCELDAMFYFETISAPFAHKHDFGFVMRGGRRAR